MSMYVYKDKERKIKLLAKNALKEDKGTRFYCPNERCGAHMYIKSVDGVSSAHFAAKQNFKHVEGCGFGSPKGYTPGKYKESEFNFIQALTAMTTGSKSEQRKESTKGNRADEPSKKPPHTISQIYYLCKAYDVTDSYNSRTIGQMLLDRRSEYMFPKGVYGWRMIETECLPIFFDNNRKEFYMKIADSKKEYVFISKFHDMELFNVVKNMIFQNRGHFIIIAGNWEPSGEYNKFSTFIHSKRQIKIV